MTDFAPSGLATAGLDPLKRVKYQLGLVLGEDEFRADQFHHRERDHQATRALHGYGTVSGLAVSYDDATRELRVAPGLAVDPAGRLMCVPVEYCADLDAWLTNSLDIEPNEVSGMSIPGPLTLYIVLCYTECDTDDVPIPSESCLSAEESRAASRIKESFELHIVTTPPPLVGEVAPTSLGGLATLVDELQGLLDVSGESLPDFDSIAGLLRAWAVERRPEVEGGNGCLPIPTDEGALCVLLARVDLDVIESPSGRSPVDLAVDDSGRPILVSTRFLQEMMLGSAPADHVHELDELADVDAPAPNDGEVLAFSAGEWHPTNPDHDHGLGDLSDVETSGAGAGDSLVFDGTNWGPGTGGGGGGAHGDLGGLDGDDHPHYLLADGTRSLSGDLSAAGNRISNLPVSAAVGDPIVRDEPASGDLTGRYPGPTISRLQGTPVDAATPRPGDALVFNGSEWVSERPRHLPFATIERFDERMYVVWLNVDAISNEQEVVDLNEDNLTVRRENTTGPSFQRRVGPESINQLDRNAFMVELAEGAALLRFDFTLEGIELSPFGGSAEEWTVRTGTWFAGQSGRPGERLFVTKFVMNTERLG